jgi:tRNA (cytidine/uridine-2'-O-)-methyltransferase
MVLPANLHIILYQPQIPQNTGNIGRACAVTGAKLHLIHPLGFKIEDRHLKRSGMDYWHDLNPYHHEDWDAFLNHPHRPKRLWLFTTKATTYHWEAQFQAGDGLVFGNEGHGAPDFVHEMLKDHRIKLPQPVAHLRSLNLSTAAGIALYEAFRQIQS